MKRTAYAFAILAIATTPALGEGGTAEKGFSLIEEGAKIILRSMIDEMEPALKDLHSEFGQAFQDMEPALRQLAEMLGDIRNYHAPEVLPNGDIIIRRKTPEELAMPDPGEDIEI
ncbi:MAG: AAA+ family ATPase [Paracoccaceae bacterium]